MKVLFTWHAAVVPGNQVYLKKLAQYKEMQLYLLIPPKWDESTSMVTAQRVSPPEYEIILGEVKNPFKGLKFYYRKTAEYLSRIQPELLFVYEEPYSYAAFNLIYWQRKIVPQAKVIFYTWQNLNCRYPLLHYFIERYVFKYADWAVAGSEDVKQVLQHRGFRHPISIIPLGLEPENFPLFDAAGLRRELGLNSFTLGYVGRLTLEKGLMELFQAVSSLNLDYQLLIIGGGPDEAIIKDYALKLGINDKVVWLKGIANQDIYKYYQAMDVLLLPSRTTAHWKEQFGRTLIEAMICKTAVLGSDSGEIPRVIGDAGLIFKEQDVRDLKEQILRLMTSADLRKCLALKGYERVKLNYTWDKVAELTYNVIREAASAA
jgi:glycosyltransferase involved in cell wall biosynthesis